METIPQITWGMDLRDHWLDELAPSEASWPEAMLAAEWWRMTATQVTAPFHVAGVAQAAPSPSSTGLIDLPPLPHVQLNFSSPIMLLIEIV